MRSTQYIPDKRVRLARGPQPLFTPNQALIDLDWYEVNVDDFFEMAARKREDER